MKDYVWIIIIAVLLLLNIVQLLVKNRSKKVDVVKEEVALDIDMLNKYSREYLNLSNQFSSFTDEFNVEMKGLLERVLGLTASTQEQTANLNSVNFLVGEVYSKVSDNSSKSEEMAETTQETAVTIDESVSNIIQTIKEFQEIRSFINTSITNVSSLSEKTSEAENLITAIDDISEQTNLLALNASIEAARAGESGRGFSVVADEIRKLSVQTSQVVESITSLIKDIMIIADQTNNNLDKTVVKIERQGENLESSKVELEKVSTSTIGLVEKNREVASASSEIEIAFENVKNLVADLNLAVEEVAVTTEEISLGIDEETKAINILNKTIDALKSNSIQLESELKPFNDSLTVVSTPNEPYYIYNEKTDSIEGLDVDLLKKAYKDTDIKLDFKITTWDDALEMIKSGAVDIIPNIAKTPERESFMSFSKSYRDQCVYAFYSLTDNRFNSYDELKNKRIGIMEGYEYFPKFDGDRSILKDESINESILFKKLLKKQVDAIIIDEKIGDYYLGNVIESDQIKKNTYKHIEKDQDISNIGFSKKNDLEDYVAIFNANIG